jgi:hypothetical protein
MDTTKSVVVVLLVCDTSVMVHLTRTQKNFITPKGSNFCSTRDLFENVVGDEGPSSKCACVEMTTMMCACDQVLVCRFHVSRTGVHRVVQVGECVFAVRAHSLWLAASAYVNGSLRCASGECVFVVCAHTHSGLWRVRTKKGVCLLFCIG